MDARYPPMDRDEIIIRYAFWIAIIAFLAVLAYLSFVDAYNATKCPYLDTPLFMRC